MPLPASFSNPQDRRWATYNFVGIPEVRRPALSNDTPMAHSTVPSSSNGKRSQRAATSPNPMQKSVTFREKWAQGRSQPRPEPSPQAIAVPKSPTESEKVYNMRMEMHAKSMRYVRAHPPSMFLEEKELPPLPVMEAAKERSRDEEEHFGRRRKARLDQKLETEEPHVPEAKGKDPTRTGPRYEKQIRRSSASAALGKGERKVPTQLVRKQMEFLMAQGYEGAGMPNVRKGEESGRAEQLMNMSGMNMHGGNITGTWCGNGHGSGVALHLSLKLPFAVPGEVPPPLMCPDTPSTLVAEPDQMADEEPSHACSGQLENLKVRFPSSAEEERKVEQHEQGPSQKPKIVSLKPFEPTPMWLDEAHRDPTSFHYMSAHPRAAPLPSEELEARRNGHKRKPSLLKRILGPKPQQESDVPVVVYTRDVWEGS